MIICSHKKIAKATEFYIQELDISKDIVLEVDTCSLDSTDVIDGAAYSADHRGIYLVELKMTGGRNPYLVLAHEMVHIRQYSEGALKIEGDIVLWDDIAYHIPEVLTYTEDFVFNSPWEKEAYSLERKLYKSWKKYELYT